MIKKLIKIGMMACVIFFTACTSKTEYTDAIPKNAAVVMGLELDNMSQKAGLNGEDGKVMVGKLKNLLKGGLHGDAAQLAERMIEHPSESGLSLEDKVYVFAMPHAEAWAVLAKVADEGKVETMLKALEKESIATSLRKESECKWTQIGRILCAFNNGTFLLLQPLKGDALGMKGTLLSLMRQKEGDGFNALPDFDKVKMDSQDIASIVNLSVMPYEWTTPLRMGVSANLRMEDIKYFLSANFESGRVIVNSESLIQNQQITSFFDVMDKVMQPIEGKYLDYFQGNTMCWVAGNMQGKELYDMLCQNPTIKQMLDNPILPVDVETLFSSVEGDFAIGYDNLKSGKYLLYADVTNSSFLKMFEELRPLLALTGGQITLDCIELDAYLMRTYYGDFWFGVKNNRLYVTNDRTWAEEIGRTYGASLGRKTWANEVKENRVFMSVNLMELGSSYLPMTGNSTVDGAIQLMRNQCDYLNLSMSDWRHGKAELVLKDKDKNLLQWLVGMFNQF